MWWVVILVVAIIGGIIGLLTSEEGERGAGFLTGLFGAGAGCGYIILQIFLFFLSIGILFAIGSFLFG